MIDIGVNLLHPQFDGDRDAVLGAARGAGLRHLVITGTDLDSSAAAARFAAAEPGLLSATAGIHPHEARCAPPDWQQQLRALTRHERVVAIGETGLDFNRDFSPRPVQEQVFRGHLELAAELGLPLFVHDREAGETVARCLRDAGPLPAGVVVHCFTGSRDDLHRYLELGCHIGITGWVCDRRRGAALRELVPEIPLERLMIETDAPFLKPQTAPRDSRGRRNEPALLPWVAQQLAELYGITPPELERITADNAAAFFGISA